MAAIMRSLPLLLSLTSLVLAAPAKRDTSPVVTIPSPSATVIGYSSSGLDAFNGIPFAAAPTGSLRLKPPVSLTSALGTVQATTTSTPACPQMVLSTDPSDFPTDVLGLLLDLPLFQTTLNVNEDCLTVDVLRPSGTTADSALPVLVYIFGGAFELGWSAMYNGVSVLNEAIGDGKPFVYVAMNYRVAGFGFMPGAEILRDGSANIGLLDQRLALEWVADNIAPFGGDPTKVTIWGESAGAISVFDQMALYDGNITYKGHPLFRGAIMDSGSVVPADPVDGQKGQAVFDAVVETAGCASASDKLDCLRALDYTDFLNAVNSVPGVLSYNSIALSYLPRPDGTVLAQSPDLLAKAGKYAAVPFIIGDQEDEGTLFSLLQSNISTTAELVEYLQTVFFPDSDPAVVQGLVDVYPDDPAQGSPFGTGRLNALYPQYKRLAALLGDITFTLTRRAFLAIAAAVHPDVPTWSYLASYDAGTPFLGTTHATDILQVIFDVVPDYASRAFRAYYYSFVYTLDPNPPGANSSSSNSSAGYPDWPRWTADRQLLLQMNASASGLIPDDFRGAQYDYLVQNLPNLYI